MSSGVLDQILLEDLARYCPQQFLSFHQCMSKPGDCDVEQAQLVGCIKTKAPSFQKIQSFCAGKLQAYDACLRTNGMNPDRCKSDLGELRDCAFGCVKQ
ncbi:hypothetical protein CANTEDRAFT_96744 [Yamadazyma tenuis ATCC 10573]|uniref:IMS import disulfide relay-system CHCH-CHCH-like Cx9C domain-containing protein n=1 Tax=Candida tenuis (strain ATCC 10573 / BCRC 21748 / CBS 615 / JCM 9827 / NBRC 10315 / NRRL Y-1498 / VKM Y-70) TaxID=590646 RepID=G3AZM8_CANTC|nr:uncharacterized protein CANTEDRAFT_96744 [Yamadazyma tenuis ATCC 10573]EGV65625.1 hypothetical protein CANTEDRAFT_96744 [Yamadazyma tenuis ATCC 10573]